MSSRCRSCAILFVVVVSMLATGLVAKAVTPKKPVAMPMTGKPVKELASCDQMMVELMTGHNIPGGAIAIVKDGRLVMARGYGFADVDNKKVTQPDSLFRIASISKPITSAVIFRLIEQGKLKLDDRAFSLLEHLPPPVGAKVDPRLKNITIAQLLSHTAGWHRTRSYDAMFIPIRAAEALGAPAPASAETVIRYMRGQPLDFEPGKEFSYSNLGYAILGRIIEKKTGKPYDVVTKEMILGPAGVTRMRIGRTLEQFRAPGEVRYYHHTPSDIANTVFLYTKRRVPWAYGGFHLEAMDSHGAWIASAVDLVKFASAIDGSRGKPLIKPESLRKMRARPAPPVSLGKQSFYGHGWKIVTEGDHKSFSHSGSLPGTRTVLVRAENGRTWAILFNSRPKDPKFNFLMEKKMWEAIGAVKEWPKHDLFKKFK